MNQLARTLQGELAKKEGQLGDTTQDRDQPPQTRDQREKASLIKQVDSLGNELSGLAKDNKKLQEESKEASIRRPRGKSSWPARPETGTGLRPSWRY